jgi:hypothetical protein
MTSAPFWVVVLALQLALQLVSQWGGKVARLSEVQSAAPQVLPLPPKDRAKPVRSWAAQ